MLKGSSSYLTEEQRAKTITMLQTKNSWDLDELVNYWEEHFGVIYQSKQSYYNLLLAAGIKWGGIKNWQTVEKAL